MNEVKATDYPSVYAQLGIDTGKLGCLMIDTEALQVDDVIPEEALYYSEEKEFAQGIVSQDVPHVTLLYGFMRSALELRPHIQSVLATWQLPQITIDKVGFFYGSDSDFIVIVALVEVTDELKGGNARLRLLPHIDTFGEYKPHITLAYVKESADWQSFVKKLNDKYAGTEVKSLALNYGK